MSAVCESAILTEFVGTVDISESTDDEHHQEITTDAAIAAETEQNFKLFLNFSVLKFDKER
jgi:hypothetical protein